MIRLIKFSRFRDILREILQEIDREREKEATRNWMCLCRKIQVYAIKRLEIVDKMDVIDINESKKYQSKEASIVIKEALAEMERQITSPSQPSKCSILSNSNKEKKKVRYHSDNKIQTVFSKDDEPSLINLGIPLDTQPSLLHPNTKEILEKIEQECPDQLRNSRLAKIIKKKLEEGRAKDNKEIILIKHNMIPFADSIRIFKTKSKDKLPCTMKRYENVQVAEENLFCKVAKSISKRKTSLH